MKEIKILEVSGFCSRAHESFEKDLNKLLKEGWKLSGDMNMQVIGDKEYPKVIYSQRLEKEV